jgi:dTDP-4-amino-4,6-dideoxygalactose transaminase
MTKEVWDLKFLTNNGPKLLKLERLLKEQWDIPHLSLVSNGTIALELAIESLDLPKDSEIITTPFTWIATASSIAWRGYTPIFVDIDKETLNIDVSKIEDAITPNTSAILCVHVFSNPCDVEEIQNIADKHNLRVIYDGAHSTGVSYKGKDLSLYGDITTHSYHATKIFNTGEGGSVITKDPIIAEKIENLRMCGLNVNTKEFLYNGTNAKMNEFSACIGLVNLPILKKSIEYRRNLASIYKSILEGRVQFQKINQDSYNFSYFPIIFNDEETCIKVFNALEKKGILTRRYFHPSLNLLEFFECKRSCPISEDISTRILCLPCHDSVNFENIREITDTILSMTNI